MGTQKLWIPISVGIQNWVLKIYGHKQCVGILKFVSTQKCVGIQICGYSNFCGYIKFVGEQNFWVVEMWVLKIVSN